MLYLIPTILAPETAEFVLSPQIKEVIKITDYYFVENVRTARRFISELKLGKLIDELIFFEVDKDTNVDQVRKYFKQIPQNQNIGVISEAGCPGVADPGAVAVKVAPEMSKGPLIVTPDVPLSALIAEFPVAVTGPFQVSVRRLAPKGLFMPK